MTAVHQTPDLNNIGNGVDSQQPDLINIYRQLDAAEKQLENKSSLLEGDNVFDKLRMKHEQ